MSKADRQLAAENAALRFRLQELEDTINSIHNGDVDALIVNDEIYTLESAHAATNRLRQSVLAHMKDAVFAFDLDDNIIYVNAAAERRYGVVSAEVLGRARRDIYLETPASPLDLQALDDRAPSARRAAVVCVHRLSNGAEIHVEAIVSELTDGNGQAIGTLAVIRDVTQRWRSELRRDALATLSDAFRDLDCDFGFEAARVLGECLEVGRVGYGTIDPRAETLMVARDWTAPGVPTQAGTLALRDDGSCIDSLKRDEFVSIADVRLDPRTAPAAASLEGRGVRSLVNVPVVERGRLVAVLYVHHASVRDWSREDLGFIRDVAERIRVATERSRSAWALQESERRLREINENLEATVQARTRELMAAEHALRQAQKMEAVGQLTGGIAHDFNNLLASMSVSLQVLQARMKQGRVEGAERYVATGLESVRRAAALTQRLLAFARRQTLDPRPTDINRLVAGMEDMIRRTMGPAVKVHVDQGRGLWATRVDASQLENSLLNLCINARDAMPGGGRLTIATANDTLDERAAAEHELTPGEYLVLSVSDTGTGMPDHVIKRVFDPFFTTKPLGQGTGLGLSMVYGFVRQSGGQVQVSSELGRGTTMRLILPRFVGPVDRDEDAVLSDRLEPGDGETVLIIEDEQTIRVLMAEVLEEAGYRTLTARDGQAGLRLLQSDRRIDCLVTDVGLPGGLNGRQVADAARVARPTLRVLFVTGYAESAAIGDGHLEPGMSILTKPFDIAVLARKVRDLALSDRTGPSRRRPVP